ncbi:MAG: uncharacterized protein QOI81_1699, partial [Actinomycetota bacterium]|nr:uncharacterized protein [Actinomycetota bacterium]
MASPGRNSLPLAIIQTLIDQPDAYPTFHLWLALDGGSPVGLAMQTQPHNVIIADPTDPQAIAVLADAVVSDAAPLPGVIGNLPFAEVCTEHIAAATGRRAELLLREGVWELTTVNDVPAVPGSARPAMQRDRDLIRRWLAAFSDEA